VLIYKYYLDEFKDVTGKMIVEINGEVGLTYFLAENTCQVGYNDADHHRREKTWQLGADIEKHAVHYISQRNANRKDNNRRVNCF